MIKYPSHLVIPDVQARPEIDLSYLSWIGQYIIDKKPDVIICIGDFADMPSLCVSPDTKILCTDHTWQNAGELAIGDKIIGFEKVVNKGRGKSFTKIKRGIVTNNLKFIAPKGYRIKTNHGEVICSADHTFLSYNDNGAKKKFRACCDLKPGWRIVSLGSDWTKKCPLSDIEIGYLGGFLDGEGSFSNGRLTWSQNNGEVALYVLKLFNKWGVGVKFYEEKDRPNIKHYYISESYLHSWKILQYIKPLRLLKRLEKELEGKTCAKYGSVENSTILEIEELENVEVIGLETSVGTYISNNLFSHNCSYDKGKKSFEGRRYKADIKAANEAMTLLLKPWRDYNRHQVLVKQKQYKPRMILTLGNHEERIMRVSELQPELDGVVSYDDLPYENWEIIDYLKPIEVDGITYVHYLANPMSGKPYSGNALNQLTKVGKSFIVGHKQTLDIATRFTIGGYQQWGIIAGACLTPDHKVLTGDLQYVDLGSLKVGDKLVSFDQHSNDSIGRSRRFKTGKVTHIQRAIKPVYKVTLQSGKEFKVTDDHLWLTKLGSSLIWKSTAKLRKGTRVPKVLDEWDTAISYDAGWLAGIYDGEGCYYVRKTATGIVGQLSVYQKQGKVLDKIKTILYNLLGESTSEHVRKDSNVSGIRIKGGLRGIAKVLGSLRPVRLLEKFIPEHLGKMQTSRNQVDTVMSKEFLGEMEIVQIAIDTGTMIVEGYPHHNCYPHFENYKGYQGNDHWRGILYLHRVIDGSFDPMVISLDYLKDRYSINNDKME